MTQAPDEREAICDGCEQAVCECLDEAGGLEGFTPAFYRLAKTFEDRDHISEQGEG